MNPTNARRRLETLALVSPGLFWLFLFLVVPVGLILTYAFLSRGTYGGIVYDFTFDNIRSAFDGIYAQIFLVSARIAAETTIISLVIGYPAAYAISRTSGRTQIILLFLVIVPFWSNYLIRTYAWIVLLNRQGVINQVLISLGAIDAPLDILYSEFAVIIGLVYSYLPFVILSIFASLQRLNHELVEASTDLGASPLKTFRSVILPLTMPGVAAGGVFVFVLSIGNFITPDLLGGGHITMVGNLIYDQYMSARDWPFGSALAFALLIVMVGLLIIQALIQQRVSRTEISRASQQ
jgi:spermidine/putrescine transport system permease protein